MKRYGKSADAAAAALAVGAVGVLGILFVGLVFALGIGITSLFVWLGNYGLHVALGVAMLGFKKTVAVGAVVTAIRALLLSSSVQVKS